MLISAIVAMLVIVPFSHAQNLSFDEIREACENPYKFHNQVAPSNLQVTCEDRSTKWVSDEARPMEMPRMRQVVSSLTSDKYSVAPFSAYLGVVSQQSACPVFKETLEVLTFTKATSCSELLAFHGTETEFCTAILDQVRQKNPDAIQVSDTGNVMDFCGGVSDQGDQGQRGQGRRGHR